MPFLLRSAPVGKFSRAALAYLYVFFVVGVVTFILFLFRDRFISSTVALLFLLPVLISTTQWGLGQGIVSGVLTFLSYNFFFLKPYYTLAVHQSQDIIALLIFLIVAILINQLVGRARNGLEAALRREHETTRMYELSLALVGANRSSEVAAALADKICQTFRVNAARVSVENIPGEDPFSTQAGQYPAESLGEANFQVPLVTTRGGLGKMLLWRQGIPFEPAEQRLLQAFAAQGALALERTALAQAENRAQVLEESDRLKTALLGSVSHELRTPLVTIKAAATSLLSRRVEWDSDARFELLTAVNEEADTLNHLVGNLLNMSKIEAGALHPNRQWNLLGEIVDGVIARMHRQLADHPVQVDIAEDVPLVPVDYMQIEQVFTNLLSNSAKYAPTGTPIALHAKKDQGDFILVQITNQSPLIEEENLQRIFDKFYRVTNADKVSGTGLGLSICKGLIEAHGGQIWADNLPEGFTFHFTLPTTLDGMHPSQVQSDTET